MKPSIRMAVLSVSLPGLAACASSGDTTSYNTPARQFAQTDVDSDQLYMARVEAAARRRGIDLHWVNPPRKIAAKRE
jgi:hypothetical protein